MTFSNFKLKGENNFFFIEFFSHRFYCRRRAERTISFIGKRKIKKIRKIEKNKNKKKKEKVLGVDGVSSFIYFVNILLKADYI